MHLTTVLLFVCVCVCVCVVVGDCSSLVACDGVWLIGIAMSMSLVHSHDIVQCMCLINTLWP